MSTNLEPPKPHDDEHPELSAGNARRGLWLFLIYLVLYAGFVGLSAFAPEIMSRRPLGGVNVAILYGMGLIAAAFVLAMVYMYLCTTAATSHAKSQDKKGGRA